LLAHAVIPHHSHQNEVCIGDSHIQAHSMEHNSCSDHKHSEEQETEDCDLNQVVVVLSQHLRSEVKCFDYATAYSHFDGFQVQLLDVNEDPISFQNVSSSRPPLLLFDYSSFVGSQMGLRGPPIV
jgi:hypothetical protein